MKSFKRQFIEKWVPKIRSFEHCNDDQDQAEQELLEAIEKDDGWISVKDCKPETGKNYLICFYDIEDDELEMDICDYNDEEGGWDGVSDSKIITHYRPLPNTPKS